MVLCPVYCNRQALCTSKFSVRRKLHMYVHGVRRKLLSLFPHLSLENKKLGRHNETGPFLNSKGTTFYVYLKLIYKLFSFVGKLSRVFKFFGLNMVGKVGLEPGKVLFPFTISLENEGLVNSVLLIMAPASLCL